jgi:hypothetical protein
MQILDFTDRRSHNHAVDLQLMQRLHVRHDGSGVGCSACPKNEHLQVSSNLRFQDRRIADLEARLTEPANPT